MRLAIFLFCWSLCGAVYPATRADADRLLADGRYREALTVYRQSLEQGARGYRLYYNAAGAAAHCGFLGEAVLYYERARLFFDGDPRLQRNLDIVRARSGARRYTVSIHPLMTTIFFFYFGASRAALVRWLILLCVLLLLLFNLGLWRDAVRRRWFRTGAITLICCILLCTLSLVMRNANLNSPQRAIVTGKQGEQLLQASTPGSPGLALLPPGTGVMVEEKRDHLCRVVLPGGASGWVRHSQLEYINREQ